MKRSKEIIINRRIMHRYQQKYKLWRHIVLSRPFFRPLLLINTNTEDWDEKAWLEHTKHGVIIVNNEPYTYPVTFPKLGWDEALKAHNLNHLKIHDVTNSEAHIVCDPNFQIALKECLTNKKNNNNESTS